MLENYEELMVLQGLFLPLNPVVIIFVFLLFTRTLEPSNPILGVSNYRFQANRPDLNLAL